jgi:hypothetical protein
MYQSQYVRYERRRDRVVPVRVIKQWTTLDGKEAFKVVRVTEVPITRLAASRESAPEAWVSSNRVETRERVLTLWAKGDEQCEPIVKEAGYDQRWLPLGDLSNLTAAQAAQSLANNNGFGAGPA